MQETAFCCLFVSNITHRLINWIKMGVKWTLITLTDTNTMKTSLNLHSHSPLSVHFFLFSIFKRTEDLLILEKHHEATTHTTCMIWILNMCWNHEMWISSLIVMKETLPHHVREVIFISFWLQFTYVTTSNMTSSFVL